ncbi:MAG TPA: GWxTD domain-containing protein [Thermoanaerobaculia bacterium]|jgi:GWxTD domain-containing protein|nr:GWxTD domain-containing protein [Thermoanaerobaculia bacterium]
MKRTAILLALALTSSAAFAGGLSKQYKNWDRTPESYFLTNAERSQWKKVRTDADAEKFIQEYKEKRGPEFEKMLGERVAVADKYFSSGSTKGSETLRGKVIIVFGPPSAIEQGNGGSRGPGVDPNSQGLGGGDKGGGGLTMSSGGASPIGSAPAAPTNVRVPTMTFRYDAEHAPKAIGKPFIAEVNMISPAYQEPTDAFELNAKFEAVAEASTHPEPAPAPKEAPPQPASQN